MKGINVGKLKQIRVLLPPMEAQNTYVEKIQAARAEEKKMVDHAGKVDSIFASLQHRAFRGEL